MKLGIELGLGLVVMTMVKLMLSRLLGFPLVVYRDFAFDHSLQHESDLDLELDLGLEVQPSLVLVPVPAPKTTAAPQHQSPLQAARNPSVRGISQSAMSSC